MTEENIEDVEEVEQTYDYPEYREAGEREFLEGSVGAFLEADADGDYVEYDGYAVAAEAVHALSEHDYHQRVQLDVVEYESTGDKCPDCGEEYDGLSQHLALSDCEEDSDDE